MVVRGIQKITVEEALKRLHAAYYPISRDKLCRGLRQGVFPFGVGVKFPNSTEYDVYLGPLERWIDAMSGDIYVPDVIPQAEEEEESQ